MKEPGDWDAATYDRIADPMTRWGGAVLERLRLDGDETVLDAGCGSGRVTEQLLARLPRGHVVALDASPSMIDEARRRLEGESERLTFVVADLLDPLPIDAPVDATLSTATFHWVLDHDRLYRNLAAAIRPGGQLVAQAGGAGNVASIHKAAAEAGVHVEDAWCFASPEDERRRLEAAGFVEVRTWLNAEPTPLEPGAPLETYLATIILRPHLARLPDSEHAAFVHEVARRLPKPEIDYVRLNIVARRG